MTEHAVLDQVKKLEKASTPLEKAEAVLAIMRGEVKCRCCHAYVPKGQLVNRNPPDGQTTNRTIAKLPCCQRCFNAWPAPGRRIT